ncbi:MAG TPA: LysR family transcriptional regulator [Rhizobiaceae bacterium]|nr:LysR family transcriptional regulator [Rhizobiaceae bacterium]
MEPPINNRQLLYFVKVVEAGSLTAAADQLRIAQPALGLQIRNLEEDLGVALIVRHSRGIEPTAAGALLFERSRAILQAMEDVQQEIKNFAGGMQEAIRFGITPSAMRLLGPDLLLEARQMMPDVFFSLVEELSFSLVATLEAGDLDAAFTYQNTDRNRITGRPIMEEDLLLISSPELDDSSEPVSFTEAARRDLVLAGPRDVIRRLAEETAERLSVPLNVIYEAQSVPATRNLIEKGLASGIMPYGSVVGELDSGTLCARPIIEPELIRTLYFVRRARITPLQSERAFALFVERAIETLTERLGEHCRPLGRPRR